MKKDTYTVSHWNEAAQVLEPSIFSVEQEFTFDALGFIVLPQLLSPAELSACRSATSSASLGELSSAAGTIGRFVRQLWSLSLPPQASPTTRPRCHWMAGWTRWNERISI